MIDQIIEQFLRGRAYLADQLQRAATSVPLNIAEGAGEYSGAEKNRFYRIAKKISNRMCWNFRHMHASSTHREGSIRTRAQIVNKDSVHVN